MSPDRPRPPSVERLLAATRPRTDDGHDAAALTDAARATIDDERRRLASGEAGRSLDELAEVVVDRLDGYLGDDVLTVINATGVIIHTNLGRAPWPDEAIAAVAAASSPLLLEIDRETGRRGARFRRAEEHLIALTGADDALVTNNNAAAVALAVALVGRGGSVGVSRGGLVEIGGGGPVPPIIQRGGAETIAGGTTEPTAAADFLGPP